MPLAELYTEYYNIQEKTPMDPNALIEAIEMQSITFAVSFLMSTLKNPASKAKYYPLLKNVADSIYIAEGLTPLPTPAPPTS
jgi:hypothetical protein